MSMNLEKLRGWQPIETAPKHDYFKALVYCPDNVAEEMVMLGVYRAEDKWSGPARWQIDVDGQYLDPTHWMPLPEPPQ